MSAFVSQVVSSVIGGFILWHVIKYLSHRERVKAVNKLKRLEEKLKRFLELEKDYARAYLTLTKELIVTLQLAAYFFLAIVSIQLVSGGNTSRFLLGLFVGTLIAVLGDLKEYARLARWLLEPERYRRELEEGIERNKRLKLNV